MYKQKNTICKPKRIRLFALMLNCTIVMKTNFLFSRNVYAIRDRTWCNKHLRHTITEKYDNNGKGGYFRFEDDNNMSYRYIVVQQVITWADFMPPYGVTSPQWIKFLLIYIHVSMVIKQSYKARKPECAQHFAKQLLWISTSWIKLTN